MSTIATKRPPGGFVSGLSPRDRLRKQTRSPAISSRYPAASSADQLLLSFGHHR